MIASSSAALPKGLDVEKLLSQLRLEEKVALTAGTYVERKAGFGFYGKA
jgi:hypothetical protein